jgi:lipopolysaccharide transport system ATP-binding protein
MFSIKSICKRVLYLSGGQIRFDGVPEEGIALYEKENRLMTAPWALRQPGYDPKLQTIQITDVELSDRDGKSRHVFDYGDSMRIRISFVAAEDILEPNFSVSFIRSDNVACCNFNAVMDLAFRCFQEKVP